MLCYLSTTIVRFRRVYILLHYLYKDGRYGKTTEFHDITDDERNFTTILDGASDDGTRGRVDSDVESDVYDVVMATLKTPILTLDDLHTPTTVLPEKKLTTQKKKYLLNLKISGVRSINLFLERCPKL